MRAISSLKPRAKPAARNLRFCAALRGFRRFPDFVDFVAETTANGRGGRLAGLLHRLAGALSASATAAGKSVLRERGERRGGGDRDELRDERALQQLDEGLTHIGIARAS